MENARARASGHDGIRFRILGPIEAWADEHRLSLGGPRQRTLLAFLLLNPNRGLSSDVLVDAVWKSRRSESHNRLAMAVARLRKALEPLNPSGGMPLRTVSSGYLLVVGPRELDSEQFNRRLQDGLHALNTGDPARALALVDDALRLWRGTPLAEVCFEDFAQPELRRLEEMRLPAHARPLPLRPPDRRVGCLSTNPHPPRKRMGATARARAHRLAVADPSAELAAEPDPASRSRRLERDHLMLPAASHPPDTHQSGRRGRAGHAGCGVITCPGSGRRSGPATL